VNYKIDGIKTTLNHLYELEKAKKIVVHDAGLNPEFVPEKTEPLTNPQQIDADPTKFTYVIYSRENLTSGSIT